MCKEEGRHGSLESEETMNNTQGTEKVSDLDICHLKQN